MILSIVAFVASKSVVFNLPVSIESDVILLIEPFSYFRSLPLSFAIVPFSDTKYMKEASLNVIDLPIRF